MASTRRKTTKSGAVFYEIRVKASREVPELSKRWYVPEGWSQKSIDRELAKVAAEFERQCKAGEILTKREQRERKTQEKQEAAKIPTLRQYGENVFMPSKTVTVSEQTRRGYQGILDHAIYPDIGDIKLSDITPANLAALLLSIQKAGKSRSTVLQCYAILSGLFRMAYLDDTVDRNPMDKVERPKPRKDETEETTAKACTIEELKQVLACADQEPLKWRAFIRLLIDTGIRRGECLGLQWQDIDFQACTITIKGNLCYTPQKGIYLDTPKTKRPRTIDISPEVAQLLKQLRLEQAAKAVSSFVFTKNGSPDPMHPESTGSYFKHFRKRYGLPGVHPHKLRHTFASIAITNGADVASVSQKLGHTNKAMTLNMYTHADQESMRRASDIFREAIKN